MDEMDLAHHLQAARTSAGLTQQELCAKADISYSTLAKIERGAIKAPSVFTVYRLAQVLGLSLDQILGAVPGDTRPRRGLSKSGVSFIYFDINGCLVRFFHRAFTEIARKTDLPADVIESAFWHFNDIACRGEITVEEFNRLFARQLGMSSIDWGSYYFAAIEPIKEMHEVVTWASNHYQIGLLSNIMSGFIKQLLDKNLIPNLNYSQIIDSSEVGTIKPERRVYEIAMQRAGIPADQIMLVDDGRTNLMAAEKLGWHVLWFDDFRPAESADKVRRALELT